MNPEWNVARTAIAALAFWATTAVAYYDNEKGGAPPDLQYASPSQLASFFMDRYTLETNSPKHPQKLPVFVDDPAAPTSGRKVMVMHLQSSDAPSMPGHPGQRTELSAKREYMLPGTERWYALSFYLDGYWPTYDKKTKFVVAQLHTTQTTVVLQPNIEIAAQGDALSLVVRSNTRPVPPYAGAIPPTDDYYAEKSNTSQTFVDLGKLQKSQWYCFVINANWSNVRHKGHMKIWMNGKMVHTQYNTPNSYEILDPTLGIWPKVGIYAPAGFSADLWGSTPAWVKSYVDFIHLADPIGIGPDLMYAETPCKNIKAAPAFAK